MKTHKGSFDGLPRQNLFWTLGHNTVASRSSSRSTRSSASARSWKGSADMALSDTVGGAIGTESGSERRLALARQLLAALRRALPATSQLELALASDAQPER